MTITIPAISLATIGMIIGALILVYLCYFFFKLSKRVHRIDIDNATILENHKELNKKHDELTVLVKKKMSSTQALIDEWVNNEDREDELLKALNSPKKKKMFNDAHNNIKQLYKKGD